MFEAKDDFVKLRQSAHRFLPGFPFVAQLLVKVKEENALI